MSESEDQHQLQQAAAREEDEKEAKLAALELPIW
jgi:hypothetical protein